MCSELRKACKPLTEDSSLHRASAQTVCLEGSQLPAVGACAIGEQPQKVPMEISLPRLPSSGKYVQLDFFIWLKHSACPSSICFRGSVKARCTGFLQSFETDREKEINMESKNVLEEKQMRNLISCHALKHVLLKFLN